MARIVQVVLQTDVEHVGIAGDLVRVKPGFARNFLVPRGLAAVATKGNLQLIEDLKRAAAHKTAVAKAAAGELKLKLEAASVKIARSVGDTGKMYGSVTSKDITEAFAALSLSFDRRNVSLSEPIRELGSNEVEVKLFGDVTAKLRVEVVKA